MVGARLAAVIEVRRDSVGSVPVDLVRAAYFASRNGTVVLVLNGVTATQVDRALDPVVASEPGVSGVMYCSPAGLRPLLRGRCPRVVALRTPRLVAALKRQGAKIVSPSDARRVLGTMGRK